MKTVMPREVIVLAGGFGTRLQTVISDIPKPMAPVAGKPFLEYVLHYLAKEHMSHVILAVGYKKEIIENYLGKEFAGLKISYSPEDEPLGTGGAIMQACNYLSGDEAFVINGDTFFDVRLGALHHFHSEKDAQLSVALKRMEKFNRYGTVEINKEGKIIGFREKQFLEEGFINGGVYCLDTQIFDIDLPRKFSFETDILEKKYKSGNIYGKEYKGYFIDIGIPEDYERAQN